MPQLVVKSLLLRMHITDCYVVDKKTQRELAAFYGVGQATISRYIKDSCYLIVERLKTLCEDDVQLCAEKLVISIETVNYAINRVNQEMQYFNERRQDNASN